MMKIVTIFNLILFIIVSKACSQDKNSFPDKIVSQQTSNHVRVEGTKLLLQIPNSYEHLKELVRYQKNDKLYIQVLESQGDDFTTYSKDFTKQSIEEQGAKVNIFKNLKVNSYDAIYMEGPSKYAGETKISLMFGDKSFIVMVLGVCKTDDLVGKEELKTILKSAYYNIDLKTSELELVNFEFDLSITKFKYAAKISNMVIYNSTGNKEDEGNSIMVGSMVQMSEEKGEAYINDLVWRYEREALLYDKNITKETINGYTSFVLNSKASKQGDEYIIYHAILLGKTSSIVFLGSGKNEEGFLDKIKSTIKTLKIK